MRRCLEALASFDSTPNFSSYQGQPLDSAMDTKIDEAMQVAFAQLAETLRAPVGHELCEVGRVARNPRSIR
jgi:hypothetical protein